MTEPLKITDEQQRAFVQFAAEILDGTLEPDVPCDAYGAAVNSGLADFEFDERGFVFVCDWVSEVFKRLGMAKNDQNHN